MTLDIINHFLWYFDRHNVSDIDFCQNRQKSRLPLETVLAVGPLFPQKVITFWDPQKPGGFRGVQKRTPFLTKSDKIDKKLLSHAIKKLFIALRYHSKQLFFNSPIKRQSFLMIFGVPPKIVKFERLRQKRSTSLNKTLL